MSVRSLRCCTLVGLAVIAGAILAWRAYLLTPKFVTYTDPNLALSFMLPKTWTGHYLTQTNDHELIFLFKAKQGELAPIFGLTRTTASAWQSRLNNKQLASSSRLMWQDGDEVIYAFWSVSSPYANEIDARQYLTMLRQVSQILDSLVFSAKKPDNAAACIQVITPTRNPATGEVKEFPTPCNVPPNWQILP